MGKTLFLFYLLPYSPHLNIVEILWRISKGKWIRPLDYVNTDNLFYTTNRASSTVGKNSSLTTLMLSLNFDYLLKKSLIYNIMEHLDFVALPLFIYKFFYDQKAVSA